MPLSRLNTQQLNAATSSLGHNLIIASAGTGKTSTIVGRIAHLIKQGILPEEILLLTFTNKAAAEMIERVASYIDKEVASRIDSGTFHAVSYRWLKKFNIEVSLKQPAELKRLFRSVYEKRSFHHLSEEGEPYGSQYLYDLFSYYQNTAIDEDFTIWIDKNKPEHKIFADIYADIFDEFEILKKEYGFANFNDLLIFFRDALKSNKVPFKEVLIDEYQDTNLLQNSIITQMNPQSLFCVGDYDQSIYAFNGADINIIASFAERYANATVYTLEKNYRSTKSILMLANQVIQKNERIYPKKLEVTRENEKNQAPKLLIYQELFEQYKGISRRIKESLTPSEEIAVIFRNNSAADGIEASLRELGVASKRKGGTSFFDTREVKAILDIYMLFINPKDMMAFIHIFEYATGVGSAIAKDIFENLIYLGNGSLRRGLFSPDFNLTFPINKNRVNTQLGLFDDDFEIGSVSRFNKAGFSEHFFSNPILKSSKLSLEGATFLYSFYKLMKKTNQISIPKSMINAIVESELFEKIKEYLSTKRGQLKDGTISSDLKLEARANIERKGTLLRDLSTPYKEHRRYLNAMILGRGDLTQGEGVNLLTIHASKGLEFKEVYIIDLMEGRFPNTKLMRQGGDLDEERRLFYVAVTRAKDRLFLSLAKYDKIKKIDFLPSVFLKEAKLIT